MSSHLSEEIVNKYKTTSNPECFYPYYYKWNSIPFEERLKMVELECLAINMHPRMKRYKIIATPYFYDCRKHKHGTWAGDISISIYFHGDPDHPFDINTVTCMGHLPVTYDTVKNKEKVNRWQSHLQELNIS